MLLGDFNSYVDTEAVMRKDVIGTHGGFDISENVERVLEFCRNNNM